MATTRKVRTNTTLDLSVAPAPVPVPVSKAMAAEVPPVAAVPVTTTAAPVKGGKYRSKEKLLKVLGTYARTIQQLALKCDRPGTDATLIELLNGAAESMAGARQRAELLPETFSMGFSVPQAVLKIAEGVRVKILLKFQGRYVDVIEATQPLTVVRVKGTRVVLEDIDGVRAIVITARVSPVE